MTIISITDGQKLQLSTTPTIRHYFSITSSRASDCVGRRICARWINTDTNTESPGDFGPPFFEQFWWLRCALTPPQRLQTYIKFSFVKMSQQKQRHDVVDSESQRMKLFFDSAQKSPRYVQSAIGPCSQTAALDQSVYNCILMCVKKLITGLDNLVCRTWGITKTERNGSKKNIKNDELINLVNGLEARDRSYRQKQTMVEDKIFWKGKFWAQNETLKKWQKVTAMCSS